MCEWFYCQLRGEAKPEGWLDSDNKPASDDGGDTMVEINEGDDVKDEKKFELKDELKYELKEEKVKTEVKLELNPFEALESCASSFFFPPAWAVNKILPKKAKQGMHKAHKDISPNISFNIQVLLNNSWLAFPGVLEG